MIQQNNSLNIQDFDTNEGLKYVTESILLQNNKQNNQYEGRVKHRNKKMH